MKTLLLMRHAKSDWNQPGVEDFERPLNDRGFEDAPRMGKALAKAEMVPDRIVASPARRAQQTAELVAKGCGFAGEIAWEADLYGAPGATWLTTVRKLPDRASTVLMVAHSPGVAEATALFLGGRAGRVGLRFPTAAIACIESTSDTWSRFGAGEGALRWFLIPRVVKAIT